MLMSRHRYSRCCPDRFSLRACVLACLVLGAVGFSGNYTNVVLRACAIAQPPYVFVDPSRSGNARFSGFAVDVLSAALELLDANVTFEAYLVPDGSFGSYSNGSWNGVVGELVSGRADVALAPLTITSDRSAAVDFTASYIAVGNEIVVLRSTLESPPARPFMFFEPFSGRLWAVTVVSAVVLMHALWLFDRLSPFGHRAQKDDAWNLSNSAVTTLLVTFGASTNEPNSWATRISYLTYSFVMTVLLSAYTASLSGIFITAGLSTALSDLPSLAKNKVEFGTVAFSAPASSLLDSADDEVQATLSLLHLYPTFDAMMAALRAGEIGAVFWASSIMEYVIGQPPCDLAVASSELIDPRNYGIPLPQNSSLRDPLSVAVLKLVETGQVESLYKKWYIDTSQCETFAGASDGPAQVDVHAVAGLFYVLLVCLGFSFAFLGVEFVVYRNRRRAGLRKFHDFLGGSPEGASDEKTAEKPTDIPMTALNPGDTSMSWRELRGGPPVNPLYALEGDQQTGSGK